MSRALLCLAEFLHYCQCPFSTQCLFCSVAGGSRWTLCSRAAAGPLIEDLWLGESHAVHCQKLVGCSH